MWGRHYSSIKKLDFKHYNEYNNIRTVQLHCEKQLLYPIIYTILTI